MYEYKIKVVGSENELQIMLETLSVHGWRLVSCTTKGNPNYYLLVFERLREDVGS